MSPALATLHTRSRASSTSSSTSTSSTTSSLLSEEEEEEEEAIQPFPFFSLPFELRSQVLAYILCVPNVIDTDFNASGITSLFLVSTRFHAEAARVFFASNTFRLFPVHAGATQKRVQPLIRKLPATYRRLISRVELRLGPHWTKPPACWKVDIKLGLKDLVNVRRLFVFVEIDPEMPMYDGYRVSKTFYTGFAAGIFEQVLSRMRALKDIRIDGRAVAAPPTGPLIQTLVEIAQRKGKSITWGNGLAIKQLNEKIDLEIGLISNALDSFSFGSQLLVPHA